MKRILLTLLPFIVLACLVTSCHDTPRPRILISTDIGGTDPDDNQSMAHLLMYNDLFDLEGLVSSPSFGNGSKEEILRMIGLYEQDYPTLKKHNKKLRSPSELRELCKQGHRGLFPFRGYAEPTEGSDWIVKCARKKDTRPLWILVWGTTEDLAQALHDAPDIIDNIRVYYIGGPNKKWGVNSYAYIAQTFPNLWIIENNATYRGFITDNKAMELIEEYDGMSGDNDKYGTGYYDYAMKGAGVLGNDFKNYYDGIVKMGDSPSLFYVMNGDPENPLADSWGGSFEPISHSSRRVLRHPLNELDTVPVYSVMEIHFKGPELDIPADSICFTATIARQQWAGYQVSKGDYVLRYSPKAPEDLTYIISSPLKELDGLEGCFVVDEKWPGQPCETDYVMGDHWYSDCRDPSLFDGKWQGVKTVAKWRNAVLEDWAKRWSWLKE